MICADSAHEFRWDPSSYSNFVDGQGSAVTSAPAAPASISAAEDAKEAQYVNIYWTNSSNNEDRFILERAVNDGPFAQLAELALDQTAYRDTVPKDQFITTLGAPVLRYRVRAANAAGSSYPSPVTTVSLSRGGPEVTAQLLAIASDLHAKWIAVSQLHPTGQVKLILGSVLPPLAINYWDMTGLPNRSYHNIGINKGLGTVTVDGKVFDQQAVNYWLAGLIYREFASMPIANDWDVIFKALAYAHIYAQGDANTWPRANCADEKWAWFLAGAALDPTLPQSPQWLQNVLPGPVNNTGNKPISWQWGFLNGQN